MTTVPWAKGMATTDADDAKLPRPAALDTLEQLIVLYQPRVARLAFRLLGWKADVEDVVQEVFLAAHQNIHRFRGESSTWTWLTRITINRCRSRMRRAALLGRIWPVVARRAKACALSPDAQSLQDETARIVRAAVAELGQKDREVIVLYYLEERSVAEVSRLVRASTNAVEVRLHRARRKLHSLLQAFGTD